MKFRRSLAGNDHFGILFCDFEKASQETIILEPLFYEIWRKPRTIRSFWKLFLRNLKEASHETIILEAFSVLEVVLK